MSQNLISASLSATQKTEIHTLLGTVKSKLSFLKSFQPEDIVTIVKAGDNFYPLLGISHEVVNKHPEILAGVFDKEEFNKDYELYEALRSILLEINEIQESLKRTTIATSSDLMVATLEVYGSVKQNKDKVPGLNATYERMKVFFSRSKRKDPESLN